MNPGLNPPPTAVPFKSYSSDWLAVFEGGGCRGAAFAGAYQAVFQAGVRFSAVAGTSSGSIVAALVAAGAEPDWLIEQLSQLEFNEILARAESSIFARPSRLVRWARRGLGVAGGWERLSKYSKAADFALFGGVYSTEGLRNWVDLRLREAQKLDEMVRFKDLTLPLAVVATDVSNSSPVVWSKENTPDAVVAHAVCASCALPFVFQPVMEGASLLVDGAAVSNSPVYLFTKQSGQRARREENVLLFSLRADRTHSQPQNVIDLLRKVAAAAIDGSSHVQLSLSPEVERVVISTGDVQATDFERMRSSSVRASLVSSGRRAAHDFIKSQNALPSARTDRSNYIHDTHQLYMKVVERVHNVNRRVLASFDNTRWFWELFPTVFAWRRRGIHIVAVVPPIEGSSLPSREERQRRAMLVALGVQVVEKAPLDFHGFLFDDCESTGAFAAVLNPAAKDAEPIGRVFVSSADREVLRAVFTSFDSKVDASESRPLTAGLECLSPSHLSQLLKSGVSMYASPSVNLSFERVPLEQVFLISRFTRAFRFRQIPLLAYEYDLAGIEWFAPATIDVSGMSTPVAPPVFERRADGSYVALEGNTRCCYSHRLGRKELWGIVVHNVEARLPGQPVPLKDVRLTLKKMHPEDRMAGYDHNLFRGIERAVRPVS